LPDAYVETDQFDSIIEVNRAAEDLIGESRGALVGKPIASLVQNTDRRSLRDVLTKMRTAGDAQRWKGTLYRRHANGPMDVTAVVRAARAGGESSHGRYVGARWLIRAGR
jgi:PAS domain S-box-containing protein